MINPKYYKSVNNLKETIAKDGISDALVDELKALRVMVVEENKPLLAKVTRLIYQHIEETGSFNAAIPSDEPIEGLEENITETEINPVESLDYLFSIMLDYTKKMNEMDIRTFVADLKEQAGEDY